MNSLNPIAGAPTASRGPYDNVVRLLVDGGGIVGGDAGITRIREAVGFYELGEHGAVAHGGARFAALWVVSGGAKAGGHAKYPHRFDNGSGGGIVGGAARYGTYWWPVAGGIGGSGEGPGDSVMFTYHWGMAIPRTGTGAVIGGASLQEYIAHGSSLISQNAIALSPLVMSNTTKRLVMREV